MENVSKTELKITGIDEVEYYIHPQVAMMDYDNKGNRWVFDMQLQRHKIIHAGGKKAERLKMDSHISYTMAGSDAVELASVKLTTYIETKRLKRTEVDAQFWAYLVNLGLAHCRAVFTYKNRGTILQGKIMPAHATKDIDDTAQQKLNAIWGRQTKR